MVHPDLTGKKVLVTGGARGLGAAMAAAFAKAGASVMIADLLDDEGRQAADQIASKTGLTTGFVHLDVRDETSWRAAVSATVDALGGTTSTSTTPGSKTPRCSPTSTPTS